MRLGVLVPVVAFAVTGCAGSREVRHETGDDGADLGLSFGAAPDLDITSIDPGGGDDSDCAAGNDLVYLVDGVGGFYKFDPGALKLTTLGTLACPSTATPFSMSVDRKGHAWVVFTDGTLFDVDTATIACKKTAFAPGQSGFTTFGMGFSANPNGTPPETLFVSDSPFDAANPTSKGLARIDTTALTLAPIGAYDKISARAEMTGTGDGRLFAAFEGTPYVVAEIDKTTAHVISEAPQNAIDYAPDTSNFAFAFWGGDFWLFVGPGTSTDVFQYQPATHTTTKRKTLTQEIVGAGVSTCAPIAPPG